MLQAFTAHTHTPYHSLLPIVYSHSQYTIHILSIYTIQDIEITIIQNSIRTQVFRYPGHAIVTNRKLHNRAAPSIRARFSSARRKFDYNSSPSLYEIFADPEPSSNPEIAALPRAIRQFSAKAISVHGTRSWRHAPLPINLPPIELISILDTHRVTRPCYACRNHRLPESRERLPPLTWTGQLSINRRASH